MSPPLQPFDPTTDDEMIAPGGVTRWDEANWMPWSADLECEDCGQIAGCDDGCGQ